MRPTSLRRTAAALLLPLVGCSSVHRWPAETSPAALAHLQRLLLPAPSCLVYQDGRRASDEEPSCASQLQTLVLRQLGAERGHELLLPELLGSAGGAYVSRAAALAALRAELERFALGAADGEAPPPALAARVRELCAAWPADGLVLVRMERHPPPAWAFALLFATLITTWPVLVSVQHSETRIDIFDAGSGGIVWRYRYRNRPLAPVQSAFGRPFEPPPETAP